MVAKAYQAYGLLIAMALFALLAMAFFVNFDVIETAGIKMELPDTVGAWQGEEMRYCQNLPCQDAFPVSGLKGFDGCPRCGGKLESSTVGERDNLPKDTLLLKKRYVYPSGQTIFATIVLSGKERSSIHRPQICLTGQGHEIIKTETMKVSLPGRPPLVVMVLDLLRHAPNREVTSYYVYWFVGKDRETSSHWMRMFWMAWDQVFHNRAHRWAYIAISGFRDPQGEEYRKNASDFVAQLYPEISLQ